MKLHTGSLLRGATGAGLMLALAAPVTLIAGPALATDFDDCAREASSQYEQGYESIGKDTRDIDTRAFVTMLTTSTP